jgi:hypothetical protein
MTAWIASLSITRIEFNKILYTVFYHSKRFPDFFSCDPCSGKRDMPSQSRVLSTRRGDL